MAELKVYADERMREFREFSKCGDLPWSVETVREYTDWLYDWNKQFVRICDICERGTASVCVCCANFEEF